MCQEGLDYSNQNKCFFCHKMCICDRGTFFSMILIVFRLQYDPLAYTFQDRVKQVKYDIYSTITLIRSRQISEATESEPAFPHLHTLLAFDTQVQDFFFLIDEFTKIKAVWPVNRIFLFISETVTELTGFQPKLLYF